MVEPTITKVMQCWYVSILEMDTYQHSQYPMYKGNCVFSEKIMFQW